MTLNAQLEMAQRQEAWYYKPYVRRFKERLGVRC